LTGPVATINLTALERNLAWLSSRTAGAKVMAVIKANAYGHDASLIWPSLGAADALAVARLDEALALRAAGCRQNVVVLTGVHSVAEAELAASHDLYWVVHARHQIDFALVAAGRVWVKVDTGMHRLGLPAVDLPDALARLGAMVVGVMSHFACADDPVDAANERQLACFSATTKDVNLSRSMANSAALLGQPSSHLDWVRPGIALFGASPFADLAPVAGLTPVMTLRATVIAVSSLQPGESVGYGGQWCAARPSTIAALALGYGDGYPRDIPPGVPVLVNGKRAPIVGRVSMDLTTVDVTDVEPPLPGDQVVLWGTCALPVEDVARAIGTIPYVLTTGLGDRVERRVTRE